MKHFFLLSLSLLLFSCKEAVEHPPVVENLPETDLSTAAIIPVPLSIEASGSAFVLDNNTRVTSNSEEDFSAVASFLTEKISEKTEIDKSIFNNAVSSSNRIILIDENQEIEGTEAYELTILQDSILLSAKTAEGAFRGAQTLRQLIPFESNTELTEEAIWLIPTGTIKDEPNYEFRSAMLDVARHFFTVDEVKKYIDQLAYYKFNHFHMHLTDDQGWRIEIKSWPRLTEVGSEFEVGDGEGGFYTQEEYKDIVQYAQDRFITVIPEIDMPGHTNAASVAYPFLNGNGKTPEPYRGMEVGFSTFDTRKDSVYQFIDDVIREISEMTPGKYFHIGGDESHVTKEEDFNYFVTKVGEIAKKYNKTPIGWDEIANTEITSNSVAQFWSKKENAMAAAEKGMKIILSPAKKAYIDMKYDKDSEFGLSWAAMIPVKDAYDWNPETYENIPQEAVLGIEAPLWAETITNIHEAEYLAFPRLVGISELAWSPANKRNWDEYVMRLKAQVPYFEQQDINYYKSPNIDWK